MDGNGRWAKQRGLPRGEGHKQGAKVFKRICEYAADRGIRYVTFYAFSTENWRRPPEEVSGIMDLSVSTCARLRSVSRRMHRKVSE